jgi:hypothetical protein
MMISCRKVTLMLLMLFIIPFILWMLSCVAKSEYNRRMEYINAHPYISDIFKHAIANGQIMVGMKDDMVIAAWGWPTRIVKVPFPGRDGDVEHWRWEHAGRLYRPIVVIQANLGPHVVARIIRVE